MSQFSSVVYPLIWRSLFRGGGRGGGLRLRAAAARWSCVVELWPVHFRGASSLELVALSLLVLVSYFIPSHMRGGTAVGTRLRVCTCWRASPLRTHTHILLELPCVRRRCMCSMPIRNRVLPSPLSATRDLGLGTRSH
jgi:hypothetical protein